MKIRTIPRELLPHSAIYRPYLGSERNGGQWGDEIIITNIFIDLKSSYRIKGEVQTLSEGTCVIYDCRNSRPLGLCFHEKDILEYNGRKMTVESIAAPSCGGKIHHYELKCV